MLILHLKFYASGFSPCGARCVLFFSLIANFLLFFYRTNSRITESLRLEKTFKNIKSRHQPDLPNPIINLCPLLPYPCLLNTAGDGDSITSLSSPFQCLIYLSMRNFFLLPHLNLLCCSLCPFPHILSLVTQEQRLTFSLLRLPSRCL